LVDRAQRLAFTHRIEQTSGEARWRTWQSLLENGDAESSRKDPKYVTHGIHPYKGKFYPQLAKALLNLAHLSPPARVLDPFCGSGTVLLESQLNGFAATGFDLNPLAVLISRAKTSVATESPVILDRTVKEFADCLAEDRSTAGDLDIFPADIRNEIGAWFPRRVAERLAWLLTLSRRVPNHTAQLVLQVLLSSLIRMVSQQEPADLRIRRRKEPIIDAPVIELYLERIAAFRARLLQFGQRMPAAPTAFPAAVVHEADSRDPSTFARFTNEDIECVITSPPYATALPYIDTDRLSILLLFGIESRRRMKLETSLTGSREIRDEHRKNLEELIDSDLAGRLGSDTAATTVRSIYKRNQNGAAGFRKRNVAALLVRYYSDMWTVLQNLSRTVRPHSPVFFVIGDNQTTAGDKVITIRSGNALVDMAQRLGWSVRERIPITVTRENVLHFRNSIVHNEILWFRSGGRASN
jgi:hypothetical protein